MNKGLCAAVLLCAVALGPRAAEPDAQPGERKWFTITGDAGRPDADTVQVDPLALKSDGDARTMPIRVNRAHERTNWANMPYRSYESRVLIDCRTRKAHHLESTFYMEPLWHGKPHRVAGYAQKPPPMLLRGMNPNPTERLIRAACKPDA